MNNAIKVKNDLSIFIIWLIHISGMIGIYLGHMDWFISKTPMNLLTGLLLLYWNFPLHNGMRSWIIWLMVYLIGMSVELIGVNTGLLFGTYHYGENLGTKVFGVPLLIGVNWVVLTFLAAYVAKRYIPIKWLAVFCGSVLMVLLDFFIEPTAPKFDFWHWEGGVAPIRNFVDWFVISLMLQLIVNNEIPEESATFPLHHLSAQFIFFIFFLCII